jgi:chloramphenicol-sensitive protein RarD
LNPAPDVATRTSRGVLFATVAFLVWGLAPIYWKTLAGVPVFEIILHRIVWSFLFLLPVLWGRGQMGAFKAALSHRRSLTILSVTTVVLACNWFLFVWAINHDHVLETSLGYYINPLVNVLLGVIFLRERLRSLQKIAVVLAVIGVGFLTIRFGRLPWISLALAVSFGAYGLIRKVIAVGALAGLCVETLLLGVPAATYLAYLYSTGQGAFLHSGLDVNLLLVGSGLFTALPLLFFTMGARRIHLSTLGFLQYIAPSGTFLLAVLVYGEPLSLSRLAAFVLIWIALGVYSWDSVRTYRRRHFKTVD